MAGCKVLVVSNPYSIIYARVEQFKYADLSCHINKLNLLILAEKIGEKLHRY
jgi:hypothetical protein